MKATVAGNVQRGMKAGYKLYFLKNIMQKCRKDRINNSKTGMIDFGSLSPILPESKAH